MYAMLSDCNLVGNFKEWWIDSGVTHNVCAKRLFSSYALAGSDENIFIRNSATVKIKGVVKISLKMTWVKVVTLTMFFMFLITTRPVVL